MSPHFHLHHALTLALLVLALPVSSSPQAQMTYYNYRSGYGSLRLLAQQNPSVLRLYSASAEFPHLIFPSNATCGAPGTRCETLIAELGGATGPPVLVLGPLRGDERVAAAAAFHLVHLLVSRARKDPWIARLLATRRIFVVPLPSAAAFYRRERRERFGGDGGELIDVEADFPFRAADPQACLRSSAAKVVDAMFRRHTFVAAVQFADTRATERDAISYSYASFNECSIASGAEAGKGVGDTGSPCPAVDSTMLRQIADKMISFAGPSYLDGSVLASGSAGELHGVRPGRFVDYASGSSARPDLVASCASPPTQNSHRAAAFVVQANKELSPNVLTLGRYDDLYRHSRTGNIVTRALRAALVAVDFASPYVFWMSGGEDFEARGAVAHVRWAVGGAVKVHATWLVARVDNETEWTTAPVSGPSMWSQGFDDSFGLNFHQLHRLSAADYEFRETLLLLFRLTAAQKRSGARLLLRADAVVDSDWVGNGTHPSSHLVQMRTNASWHAGASVRGRAVISSASIVIDVPPVSGLGAFLEYVWEWGLFLLIGVLACVVPPGVLLWMARRGSGAAAARWVQPMARARRRVRRALRSVTSRTDVGAVLRRARSGGSYDRRIGGAVPVSAASLLGTGGEALEGKADGRSR